MGARARRQTKKRPRSSGFHSEEIKGTGWQPKEWGRTEWRGPPLKRPIQERKRAKEETQSAKKIVEKKRQLVKGNVPGSAQKKARTNKMGHQRND